MEINSYNIGDWVLCCGNICKVVTIDFFYYSLCDKNFDIIPMVKPEEITPIPLSREIVGNNGWKKSNDILLERTYPHGALVLEFGNRSAKVFVKYGKYGNKASMTEFSIIKYVHELQHIMSVIGINDDLKLQQNTNDND